MATDTNEFDLLEDRWIPVRTAGGAIREESLLGLFRQASEMVRVVDESPLVVLTLHRLLTAMLVAALRLQHVEELVDIWRRGVFSDDLVAEVEAQNRGHFRLFDARRPFFQSGDIKLDEVPKEAKTVGYLLPELSTGTNVAHFEHRGDEDHALCGVCCAKGLLVLSAFATAGGAGIKAGLAGVPPIYLLPVGRNLFETLLLNYPLPDFRPATLSATDSGPRWLQEPPVVPKGAERLQVGLLEALTWAPRRVRLFPSAAGQCSRCGRDGLLVRKMVFQQGYSLSKEVPWREPWAAYRYKKGTEDLVPVRPREDRELWRDFPDLVLCGKDCQPYILRHQPELFDELPEMHHDVRLRLEAFGIRTDMKAKIFEWRHDRFDFPASLLMEGRAAISIKEALETADEVARVLRQAIRRLHPISDRESADREALRAALAAAARVALQQYWHAIQPAFHQLLTDPRLTLDDTARGALQREWQQGLRRAAREVFHQAADGVAAKNSDSYRRGAKAAGLLFGWMKKNLQPQEETHDEREPASVG